MATFHCRISSTKHQSLNKAKFSIFSLYSFPFTFHHYLNRIPYVNVNQPPKSFVIERRTLPLQDYPPCFSLKGSIQVPLKTNIQLQLQENRLDLEEIHVMQVALNIAFTMLKAFESTTASLEHIIVCHEIKIASLEKTITSLKNQAGG